MPHQNQWWSIMMRWLLTTKLFFVVALVIWNIKEREERSKNARRKNNLVQWHYGWMRTWKTWMWVGKQWTRIVFPGITICALSCGQLPVHIHIIYEHYYGEKETFALFDAERSETHVFVIGIKGIVLVCTLTSSTSFIFAFFVVDWLDRQ